MIWLLVTQKYLDAIFNGVDKNMFRLRIVDRRSWPNVKNISTHIFKNYDAQKNENQSIGIQCHECKGFGHIRVECPTYLKKQLKGLSISWFDEGSD